MVKKFHHIQNKNKKLCLLFDNCLVESDFKNNYVKYILQNGKLCNIMSIYTIPYGYNINPTLKKRIRLYIYI